MSRAYRKAAMSPKQREMSRPHERIHILVRGSAYSFFFFGGTTQSGLFGLALAGGGDFLLELAFGAALGLAFALLLEVAFLLSVFFFGSALGSWRFRLRLEAGRVVSVSAALAFDFDLLAGASVSAAGRRALRRDGAAGSSGVRLRDAAAPDLVFDSSPAAEAFAGRDRDLVAAPAVEVGSVSRGPERAEAAGALAFGAASVGSPAFGVAAFVPR